MNTKTTTNTTPAPTALTEKVAAFKLIARDSLRMELISKRLSKVANLEADLADPKRKHAPKEESFDEKAYQEYIRQPGNQGKTRLDYLKAKPGKKGDDGDTETVRENIGTRRNPIWVTRKRKVTPGQATTVTGVTQSAPASPPPGGGPTAADVPPGTRRKAADGTYWRNDNGVISQEK